MGKRQTRRSISVRGVTYEQVRAHCAATHLSMSDFIEERIAEFFKSHPDAAAVATQNAAAQRAADVGYNALSITEKRAYRNPGEARARAAALAVHPVKHIDPTTIAIPIGKDDKAKSRPAPRRVKAVKPKPSSDRTDYRAVRF